MAVWTHGLMGNYHYGHQGRLVLKGRVAATLPEIMGTNLIYYLIFFSWR
jgi:hypothetical protein